MGDLPGVRYVGGELLFVFTFLSPLPTDNNNIRANRCTLFTPPSNLRASHSTFLRPTSSRYLFSSQTSRNTSFGSERDGNAPAPLHSHPPSPAQGQIFTGSPPQHPRQYRNKCQAKVNRAAEKYHRSCDAMLVLSDLLIVPDWADTLPVLKSEDVRGLSEALIGESEGSGAHRGFGQ